MRIRYHLTILTLLSVVLSFVSPPDLQANPCSSPFLVVQTFPTSGPEQTRWEIQGCRLDPNAPTAGGNFGLVIGLTFFRTSPTASPIQVFHDARVSEILVPYHTDSARFFDISAFSEGLLTLGDTECPPAKGTRLESDKVCKEVRDRGLAWKDDTGARRGEELVLWGVLQAFHYKYVIEWTFRDDGVIMGRVGPTGRNSESEHDVAHMHTITWRMDIDLNGPGGDSVRLGKHRETGLTATDSEALVQKETGLKWEDLFFNTLNIYDAGLTNGQGKPTSYHLTPLRAGTARHNDSDEAYTKKDFWVTRLGESKTAEMSAKDLPSYVNGQSVVEQDIVVWYTGSLHHIERDEDDNGPTQVMWVGFMLKPHDLFDASPLFP